MPTLLDTAEFALAKATLDTTLQRIEKARQDRLESVRKYLQTSETELERVKKQALALPTDIARYRTEIARLEATTREDILREAMDALKAECWGPPGEVVEVQSPKPHACPRCDEGMREVELLIGRWVGIRLVIKDNKGIALDEAADNYGVRFTRPDVPPRSEWCDGSGKGGAE